MRFFQMEYGVIPLQITVDKGSETGGMYAFQKALSVLEGAWSPPDQRFTYPYPCSRVYTLRGYGVTYAPDVDLEAHPCFVALTSTHNIPIEGLWHWFREHSGRNIFYHLTRGQNEGLFNPNVDIHVKLFNWIFPDIVQSKLDKFRNYWNKHHIRNQKSKNMPSGASPMQFLRHPEKYGGQRMGVGIPQNVIQALRETLPTSHEEAFRWVDAGFENAAATVWESLGKPPKDLGSAWHVFGQMVPLLMNMGL
ncbi:hypothetical protein CERSUDRAFT_94731 [Gelatoporia subvermispora B]|uniref:Integrase core domain-containing protein n=1 Tax=Ceriporiopsis subvermispora (strain B) TaxID=914234 RepID=M2RFY3_CERS8|nr:hypothetical protein CERSUDRAFT_94731 [Gelatoporia subvermispora B]